jgi:hypothetical protein
MSKIVAKVAAMDAELKLLRQENEKQRNIIEGYRSITSYLVNTLFDVITFKSKVENARLPLQFREHKIKYMQVGQVGYCVPWAVSASQDGRMWINENFTIHENSGGTVNLQVKRVCNGYEITPKTCEDSHRWDAENIGNMENHKPVVKLR